MPTITQTQNDDIFAFPTDPAADAFNDTTIFGGSSAGSVVSNAGTVNVNVDSDAATGDDSIRGTQGDDIIYGGDGADTIDSSFGNNYIGTLQALDSIGINLADPANAALVAPFLNGGDTVYGGSGDDVITSAGPDGFGGLVASSIRDTVYGGDGNDSITGNVEQAVPDFPNSPGFVVENPNLDTLYGGFGNDTIDGLGGPDQIFGGDGDDVVFARAGEDTTDGGDGIDTIDFTNDAGAVTFDMESGATTVFDPAGTTTESNINYENAVGSSGGDVISGSAGDNSINGAGGEDNLSGGGGNDTFVSGSGNDVVTGGEDVGDGDIDVLDYSGDTSGLTVRYTGDEAGTASGASTDTDTFSEIERIIFTDQNDSVRADNDTVGINIDTGAGDDFVRAGQGADSMDGGIGTDELSYLGSAAPVTIDVGAGTATGGDGTGDEFTNFEDFALTDGNDSLTGDANDNSIAAQNGDDSVFGGAGNDTIIGGEGDDTIEGGVGADSLNGDLPPPSGVDGIDTLSYESSTGGVTVDLENNSVSGGDAEGDSIIGFENIIGSGIGDSLTGSGEDNTITAGGGDDTINALDGNDSVDAGAGNDIVFSSDGNDTLEGGAGTDTYDASDSAGPVSIDMGNNTAVSPEGTDTISGFENAIGSANNDDITGDGGDNSLDGGDGDDTLDGGAGNDEISGGDGNDTIEAGAGNDTLDGGAGDDDTLQTTDATGPVTVDLGAGTISGTGIGNDTVTGVENVEGSAFNDDITGDGGDNSLDGGDGDDTLDGGAGNDEISGGDGNDTIEAGAGNDTLDGGAGDDDTLQTTDATGPVTIDLGAGTLSGAGIGNDSIAGVENVEGTAFNDDITGDGGDNSLDGGDGDDTLDGGAGNDEISGGDGNDTIEAGAGNDTLDGGAGDDDTLQTTDATGPVTIDLGAGTISGTGIGNDTVTGFENATGSDEGDDITGDGGDNSLDGGDGNDTVDGGDGNDDVGGGAGDDTVDGGTGNDTVYGGANDDIVDGGADDDTVYGGDGDDSVTGGDGNDTVYGGDGTDTVEGGPGDDTLYGGLGDDDIVASTGDTVFGEAGDDEIFVGSAGLTGTDAISIVGGETDEEDAIDPENNPGGRLGDVLTVGLQAGETADVVYGGPGGAVSEDGTVNILDAGGNTISTINFSEIENIAIVCFTRGTMIQTPNGEVAIEDLSEGDLVLTRDNGAQPLRWIGSQEVAATGNKAPVMIKKGALGNDRDLRVSQLHRMLVADWRAELMFDEPEVLVAAKHLANGDTIFVDENPSETVEYFHMLFDGHEIVTANGAASESFHPGQQGMGWMADETREEILDLFPQLRDDIDSFGDAARATLKAYEAKALKR